MSQATFHYTIPIPISYNINSIKLVDTYNYGLYLYLILDIIFRKLGFLILENIIINFMNLFILMWYLLFI